MIIRAEEAADSEAISEVTAAAFQSLAISQHTEQYVTKALRKAHALSVSLVAEFGGQVVGHVAFSPVSLSDGSPDWYGLGPISVWPQYQRQGIGKSLIHEGLSSLKAMGGQGCVLVGDPNYYQRFGFANNPKLTCDGIPQAYFLVLSFGRFVPEARVKFHPAFTARA
jgi:putative acetyltransferase